MKRTVLAAIALGLLAGCNCAAAGEQAQECKDYIACFERTPGGAPGVLDSSYGPMGTCWGTPMSTASCASNCGIALNAARATFPDAGC